MYVSWVLGDKLRIATSSIMRWRRGEIGLVIGGLLSVGLHERAILADRTPPTMLQLRLGRPTAKRNLRTKVSKPPKPTILDLSHRPHHRRLPRQRFSATGFMEYRPVRRSISLGFDVGRSDHLRPLFGVVCDELPEGERRQRQRRAAKIEQPLLHPGI